MSTERTGSDSTAVVSGRRNWSVVSSSASGGAYAPGLATSGSRATGSPMPSMVRHGVPSSNVVRVSSVARQQCNALLNACIDDLNRAFDHDEQYILRTNALEQLKERLARLWSVRSQREPQFAEVVNMLQLILAERDIECFEDGQLKAIASVFERLRDEPTYDDSFLNEVTVDLLRNNVDVFRGIE